MVVTKVNPFCDESSFSVMRKVSGFVGWWHGTCVTSCMRLLWWNQGFGAKFISRKCCSLSWSSPKCCSANYSCANWSNNFLLFCLHTVHFLSETRKKPFWSLFLKSKYQNQASIAFGSSWVWSSPHCSSPNWNSPITSGSFLTKVRFRLWWNCPVF